MTRSGIEHTTSRSLGQRSTTERPVFGVRLYRTLANGIMNSTFKLQENGLNIRIKIQESSRICLIMVSVSYQN